MQLGGLNTSRDYLGINDLREMCAYRFFLLGRPRCGGEGVLLGGPSIAMVTRYFTSSRTKLCWDRRFRAILHGA